MARTARQADMDKRLSGATSPVRDKAFKAKLEEHVEHRPAKSVLVQKNIIKATFSKDAAPKLQQVMQTLSKSKAEDKLSQKLSCRRSVNALVGQGIMIGLSGEARVAVVSRVLQRNLEKDRLANFLEHRPTLEEVVRNKQNLLEDTMTWTRQVMSGTIPLPRNCHTAENVDGSIYLLSGYGTGGTVTDLLVLDSATHIWTRPLVGGQLPMERYSHTCSVVGTRLFLFGGFSFNGYLLSDLHIMDTNYIQPFYANGREEPLRMLMWYQPTMKGTGPSPRAGHTAVVIESKIIFFGGNDGQTLYNDMYILDLDSMTWSTPTVQGKVPSPRAGHTANLTGLKKDKMVVCGGGTTNGPVNDLYILHIPTMVWSQPRQFGTPPSARVGHTATTLFPTQLLVFGGCFMDKVFNDLHIFDVETCVWSRPSDTGTLPIPRAGHTCTALGTRLYIFGGGDTDDVFNDLHVLDTAFLRLDFFKKKARLSISQVSQGRDKEPAVFSHSEPSSPVSAGRQRAMSDVQRQQELREEQKVADDSDKLSNRIKATRERVTELLGKAQTQFEEQNEQQATREREFLDMMRLRVRSRQSNFAQLRKDLAALSEVVLDELQELQQSVVDMQASKLHRRGASFSVSSLGPVPLSRNNSIHSRCSSARPSHSQIHPLPSPTSTRRRSVPDIDQGGGGQQDEGGGRWREERREENRDIKGVRKRTSKDNQQRQHRHQHHHHQHQHQHQQHQQHQHQQQQQQHHHHHHHQHHHQHHQQQQQQQQQMQFQQGLQLFQQLQQQQQQQSGQQGGPQGGQGLQGGDAFIQSMNALQALSRAKEAEQQRTRGLLAARLPQNLAENDSSRDPRTHRQEQKQQDQQDQKQQNKPGSQQGNGTRQDHPQNGTEANGEDGRSEAKQVTGHATSDSDKQGKLGRVRGAQKQLGGDGESGGGEVTSLGEKNFGTQRKAAAHKRASDEDGKSEAQVAISKNRHSSDSGLRLSLTRGSGGSVSSNDNWSSPQQLPSWPPPSPSSPPAPLIIPKPRVRRPSSSLPPWPPKPSTTPTRPLSPVNTPLPSWPPTVAELSLEAGAGDADATQTTDGQEQNGKQNGRGRREMEEPEELPVRRPVKLLGRWAEAIGHDTSPQPQHRTHVRAVSSSPPPSPSRQVRRQRRSDVGHDSRHHKGKKNNSPNKQEGGARGRRSNRGNHRPRKLYTK